MNAQAKPAEGRALAPIEVLKTQLEERAAEFATVLPSHITPAKLQRTVITAVQSNPTLLACERRSFLTACMKSAQDGLLPDGREAAIVPFNHRHKDNDGWHTTKIAQYMPMVFGLRKKILQSGEITDIFASVVYRQELEGEHPRFVYEEGTERMLRHKPILTADFRPTDDDIVLAYSVATFANGSMSFEVMRRYEIDEVREASQTGAQFDAKGHRREAKGPWADWFGEMCKKTVLRRHSKSLPQSGDIIADVEADDLSYAAQSPRQLQHTPLKEADPPEYLATDEGGDGPEPEPELKPLPRKPKPTRQVEPEPEPEPDAEPLYVEQTEEGTPEEGEDLDEYGITRSEHETLADDYIGRAKNCEFIADLRKLEREAGKRLPDMPADIHAAVDSAFTQATARLTKKRGDEA